MSYELNLFQTGWVCPKCGRVYAPSQPMCLYCSPDYIVTTTTDTETNALSINKDLNDSCNDFTMKRAINKCNKERA